MTTWIFQGNPNYFDITGYLRACPEILWEARQNKALMAVGDLVYMWRADSGKPGTGGVIARGTIINAPQYMDDIDAEKYYKVQFKVRAHIKAGRVKIRIDSLHLTNPALTRRMAQNDPVLSALHIMTARAATNFVLKPGEAKRLDEIYRAAQEREKP